MHTRCYNRNIREIATPLSNLLNTWFVSLRIFSKESTRSIPAHNVEKALTYIIRIFFYKTFLQGKFQMGNYRIPFEKYVNGATSNPIIELTLNNPSVAIRRTTPKKVNPQCKRETRNKWNISHLAHVFCHVARNYKTPSHIIKREQAARRHLNLERYNFRFYLFRY